MWKNKIQKENNQKYFSEFFIFFGLKMNFLWFFKFKTIKYKNQKRKIKSKICGPLDEIQNALVIKSKGSGALCISWLLVNKTLDHLLNQIFEKYRWRAFIGWKMTRWSSLTSSQSQNQVAQSIKLEHETYAIRFVSSR